MGKSKASRRPKRRDHDDDDDGEIVSQRPGAGAIAPSTKRFEALGVLMLIGALLLCFALFSFDPGDSSGAHNLVGPVGRELANVMLLVFGIGGYAAALVLVGLAGAVIIGRSLRPSPASLICTFAILTSLTVLAHLLMQGAPVLGHPAGGLVGAMLGRRLADALGGPGAGLVAVGVMLMGILGISDLSLGAALLEAWQLARGIVLRVRGYQQTQREARKAAADREETLIEAERSRRAQAKLEADEKERRLLDELEEKKRLAILKATAKAEERALAKIAALEAKERVEQELLDAEEEDAPQEQPEDPIDDESPPSIDDPIVLGIPGPAAEAKIIIGDAADPAEVLEEIDRLSRIEPADEDEEAVDDEEDEEEDNEEEALEEEEGEDEEIDAGEDIEEESADGITIHARKHIEPQLEGLDEGAIEGEAPTDKAPVAAKEKRIYQMPPIHLLDYEGKAPEPIDGEALRARATRLEEKLKTYGVEGRVTAIRPGPVVTTYEYQPAPGVKVAKIASLSDDIAMSMEAMRVRIVAPIPGRGVVGIELPNDVRESVYLKELIAHDSFKKSKSLLTLALGKDAEGEPQVRDLRSMPHFLIAGTTGSGKSVSVNAMILSILYKATPDQVKFIMVDPKMLELSLYEDIPHLLLPVVTDPRKASLALQWAVDEMERRYQMLSDLKVRDIDGFNRRLDRLRLQRETAVPVVDGEEEIEPPQDNKLLHDPWPDKQLPDPLPYIVVLIDEFADLMCVAPRDVEASVQRLAQKARAAGIHVMLATQRPSTDVITGVIKNNFPSRISFRVASRHDSATILNAPGAENLLGMGDMLCLGVGAPTPTRIHGAFVSEEEVQRVVDFWKAQAKPTYDATILKKRDDDEGEGEESFEHDEMYDRAVQIVTETRKASISALQRRLRVGYNRAARMIEMMETEGIVGPASGPKGEREVLVRGMGPDGPPRT
jgi:S-DNA-T family DNA segregation ATPase FtsK/SpoIIIE